MEALRANSSASDNSTNTALLSRTGYTMLAVIMGVFSVTGIILNVLVIAVTVKHRQLRQPLSYALVNLAICDLGCAMFGGLPTMVMTAMGYFSLGRTGCVIEAYAVAIFGKSGQSKAMSVLNIHGLRIMSVFQLSFRNSEFMYSSSHFC